MARLFSSFVLLIAAISFSVIALAQSTEAPGTEQPAAPKTTWQHFENLVATITEVERDLEKARQKLIKAQYDAERQQAQLEVESLNQELTSLNLAWEMWATGGVDLQMFKTSQIEEKFDWKRELESVFEPILVELRRLTERPRKIERLRSEQMHYQQRLSTAETALNNIKDHRAKAPPANLTEAFAELEKSWQKRRDDLQGRLDLVNFELNELLAPRPDAESKAVQALKELFSGRLLNLFLAVLAGALVYTLVWQANRLYARNLSRRSRSPALIARVTHLFLVMLGSVLALLAGMSVLYARGDWILLGLLIIILVGLVLALQRYLPGYMTEAKLLLNVGPVREGERVLYNGLPWKVQTLRVYSTLSNPLLTGGELRLPLNDLISLISRPYDEREPWFPTRENDFVVLSDETFGRVVLQSPETVLLRTGGALRSFPTTSFLDQTPKNLSLDGFAVILRFGVDYQHQADVTGSILTTLESFIRDRLAEQPFAGHIQKVALEFAQAGASSLDFLGIISCDSAMAESYLQLNRLLQRIAVEACNAHGWVIPFNQMTVHVAREEV